MALKGRSVRPCNWHLWNNTWSIGNCRANAAVVLIHAINPFGYAWHRRFNENNVDINRNFLLAEEAYVGRRPPLAGRFRNALKLSRPRARFGFWAARMVMLGPATWGEFDLGDAAGRTIRLSRLVVLRGRRAFAVGSRTPELSSLGPG